MAPDLTSLQSDQKNGHESESQKWMPNHHLNKCYKGNVQGVHCRDNGGAGRMTSRGDKEPLLKRQHLTSSREELPSPTTGRWGKLRMGRHTQAEDKESIDGAKMAEGGWHLGGGENRWGGWKQRVFGEPFWEEDGGARKSHAVRGPEGQLENFKLHCALPVTPQ